jgi:hypothetical protein
MKITTDSNGFIISAVYDDGIEQWQSLEHDAIVVLVIDGAYSGYRFGWKPEDLNSITPADITLTRTYASLRESMFPDADREPTPGMVAMELLYRHIQHQGFNTPSRVEELTA